MASFNVGIIGAGKAGLEIYEVLHRSSVTKVAYVCDHNLDAPAMVEARAHGVETLSDMEQALCRKVDYLIDVTGNHDVFDKLAAKVNRRETHLVHADLAYFFFSVIEHLDEDDEADTMKDRYLSFHLDEEDYAINVAVVTEIVGVPKISFIPDMPHYIKGVVNLRGIVFPVMDLRMKFGFAEAPYGDRTCVVVVRQETRIFGLVVDYVNETLEIPEKNIEPPPRIAQSAALHHRFLKGIAKVGEKVKIVIDVEALLSEEDVEIH